MKLHIDVETYSSEDIKRCGAYRYTGAVDFEILMIAYSYDRNPVQIIDLSSGEKIPEHFRDALLDETTTLCAHNATFERLCFRAYGLETDISKWECTMVKAAYCGFPLPLALASEAMGLANKKDSEGKRLITYFCGPIKPTIVNGMRTRNYHHHDTEKWEAFKQYCIQDVEVERDIDEDLEEYKMPEFEREMYCLDQEINDRGVGIDEDFVGSIQAINVINKENLINKMRDLTELANPNSQPQLTGWLTEAIGRKVTTLAKDTLPTLLKEAEGALGENLIIKEVIDLRMRASKTSISKYVAMERCVGWDGRGRGFFQFYGANRTGRWAGRLVQLQNLPRIYMSQEELDEARRIFRTGDFEKVNAKYDKIADRISQLIRTAFVAGEGKTFVVSDFAAIEARVIAWLANEKWRLEVFKTHGKIYEASASAMFNVPIDEVTKENGLRAKGKVAELALGYQGGVGAMKQMGAEDMGLSETEMAAIVSRWRIASPAIVKLWSMVEKAALACTSEQRPVVLRDYRGLRFEHNGKCLTITLPSGRKLFYQEAQLTINRFQKTAVRYKGIDTHTKKWAWIDSYGGKFVENIVQAIARDLLMESMQRLDKAGYEIVLHVHDEAAVEIEKGNIFNRKNQLRKIDEIMGQPVDWAEGLPLAAEGYVSDYYKKD
jgi:DNA polymerase